MSDVATPTAPHRADTLDARTPPEGFAHRLACPLCGEPRSRSVIHVNFPDIPVLRCDRDAGGCGFIWPAWTMTTDGMARYYREVFASPWHRKGQELNSLVNIAALRRMIDLRRVGSFLDVGAGYGFLLSRLRRAGIAARGCEPSVQEAAWGREHLSADIATGFLDDAALPESAFDVVACFEVIEHAPDPRALVASMARHCKPGGWVLVNTDNFDCWAVRRLGPRFAKWIPHSHVSDFTPPTLIRCMEAVPGLKVERTLSYTAWENALRGVLAMLRGPADPAACFSLKAELGREMNRAYRFWPLRVAMARAWFSLSASTSLGGSMMYVAARKIG